MEEFWNQFDEDELLTRENCQHLNNDGISCSVCFQIITHISKNNFSDSSHYLPRKIVGGTIRPEDLASLNIPMPIVNSANIIFEKVVDGRIFRGGMRRALICGALLHSYREKEMFISLHHLSKMLNTNIKSCLRALKEIDLTLWTKDREMYLKISRCKVNIEDTAIAILNKMGFDVTQINLKNYMHKLHKNCRVNTASTIIAWLWMQDNNSNISLEEIAKETHISVNTVKKALRA